VTVMISYSHDDVAMAEQVVLALKVAGLDPRIDYENCGLGGNFVDYMDRTLAVAKSLVLLHSRSASTSYWVREEWLAALATRRILVLPFLLDETPLPPLLASRVFADARVQFADALILLVRRLVQQFQPLAVAPTYASGDGMRSLVNCTLDQLMAVAVQSIKDEGAIRRFLASETEFETMADQLPAERIENRVVDLVCLLQQRDGVRRFANWLDKAPPPLGMLVRRAKASVLADDAS
jgi:hypothetical protein